MVCLLWPWLFFIVYCCLLLFTGRVESVTAAVLIPTTPKPQLKDPKFASHTHLQCHSRVYVLVCTMSTFLFMHLVCLCMDIMVRVLHGVSKVTSCTMHLVLHCRLHLSLIAVFPTTYTVVKSLVFLYSLMSCTIFYLELVRQQFSTAFYFPTVLPARWSSRHFTLRCSSSMIASELW